ITTETTGTAVTTYVFDQAGNEQAVQTPTGLTTNVWDTENRLTGVQMPTGRLNTMAYRVDNLRHQLVDSEGSKLMAWDEMGYTGYVDLVQERTGVALRTYYRGFMLAAMRDEVAGANRYFHGDHQGTTQALTDGTGGVTDRFAADAWGVQVKRTGLSINRQWYVGGLGYTGQVDQVLDYVRARYLKPERGRWLARDQIQRPRRPAALYGYVQNQPSRLVDPAGLFSVD